MSLTNEERRRALEYAEKGSTFMFIPSAQLSNMITKGHPQTEKLNKSLRVFLIERDAIKIDTNLIVQYCRGELDNKNTWLLDHGDIKVIPWRYPNYVNFDNKIEEN